MKLQQGSYQGETDQQELINMADSINSRGKKQLSIYLLGSIRDCTHWISLDEMSKVIKVPEWENILGDLFIFS